MCFSYHYNFIHNSISSTQYLNNQDKVQKMKCIFSKSCTGIMVLHNNIFKSCKAWTKVFSHIYFLFDLVLFKFLTEKMMN